MDQLLKQFALTDQEVIIYKDLLKRGGSKVSEIAERTKIIRTSCQEYIRSLEEKGFVNSAKIGKKIYYQVEDPDKFRQIINERQFVVDRLISELKNKADVKKWEVRSLSLEEVKINVSKAKRKGVVRSFGNTKVGGALINGQLIILYSENQELPAIEIESNSIAELHRHLLK